MIAGCGREEAVAEPAVRLVHTFNRAETAALDDFLAGREQPVATALLPFARGQSVLHEMLRSGLGCPDVARIDATWLPGLVEADLLRPAPAERVAARRWLPEAAALAEYRGARWALPHSLDGLAVVYRPQSIEGLASGAPDSVAGPAPARSGPASPRSPTRASRTRPCGEPSGKRDG